MHTPRLWCAAYYNRHWADVDTPEEVAACRERIRQGSQRIRFRVKSGEPKASKPRMSHPRNIPFTRLPRSMGEKL